MDFAMTDEQRLIVEQVRRFVRMEVAPLEDKLDPDESRLGPDDYSRLVSKVKDMGLHGLGVPPEYGGPDIDTVSIALAYIRPATEASAAPGSPTFTRRARI